MLVTGSWGPAASPPAPPCIPRIPRWWSRPGQPPPPEPPESLSPGAVATCRGPRVIKRPAEESVTGCHEAVPPSMVVCCDWAPYSRQSPAPAKLPASSHRQWSLAAASLHTSQPNQANNLQHCQQNWGPDPVGSRAFAGHLVISEVASDFWSFGNEDQYGIRVIFLEG